MTSRHIVSTLPELLAMAQEGGILFRSQRDLDSASLVRGRKVYLWRQDWESDRYKCLQQVVTEFNLDLDPSTLTPSQVSKKFSKELLLIPNISRGLATVPKQLCKDKSHWHFLKYQRCRVPISWEFDIKSAYVSYLLSNPSPYYYPVIGYKPQDILRARLAEAMKVIPKPFRLMLFGFWCSDCITGEKWNPHPKYQRFEKFAISKVYSAPLYNACHLAMRDLYRDMRRISQTLGKGNIRSHTDSFLVTPSVERKTLFKAFIPLVDRKIKLEQRGFGESILYDINNGIVAGRMAMHPSVRIILDRINPPPLIEPILTEDSIQESDIKEFLELFKYANI